MVGSMSPATLVNESVVVARVEVPVTNELPDTVRDVEEAVDNVV